MTKKDFIVKVTADANKIMQEDDTKAKVTQKIAAAVIDSAFEAIIDGMKNGQRVIPHSGFIFSSVWKEAHVAKNNLFGGGEVEVPGKYIPKIKFGPHVKEGINSED